METSYCQFCIFRCVCSVINIIGDLDNVPLGGPEIRSDPNDSIRGRQAMVPRGSTELSSLAGLHTLFLRGRKQRPSVANDSRIVNYADDLVILRKRSKADEALWHMREIMGQLK